MEQRLTARLAGDGRLPVAAGLLLLTLLAWAYTASLAGAMPAADGMAGMMAGMPGMEMPAAWGVREFGGLAAMWMVMMVAMMTPAVAPAVLLFDTLARERRRQGRSGAPVPGFLAGYLLAWGGFSLLAALAQWSLHASPLAGGAGDRVTRTIGGVLLLAAGAYQWLPFKHRCLEGCQSPLGFFSAHWREGLRGALAMGARHGATCVACCWLLMLLLFVAGVMNLLWVALLAGVVLVERLWRAGTVVPRLIGVACLLGGAWLLGGR